MPKDKKKLGLTSVEASALILSNGQTNDAEIAARMEAEELEELDALERSFLRSRMGFNFKMKEYPSFYRLYSIEGPRVSTRVKYDGVLDEKFMEMLADGCVRLKAKWEAKRDQTS